MPCVWCEKTEGSDDESVAGKERGDKHFPHIHWRDGISKVKICVSHLVMENSTKLCQHAMFNNASMHAVTTMAIQEDVSVKYRLFSVYSMCHYMLHTIVHIYFL